MYAAVVTVSDKNGNPIRANDKYLVYLPDGYDMTFVMEKLKKKYRLYKNADIIFKNVIEVEHVVHPYMDVTRSKKGNFWLTVGLKFTNPTNTDDRLPKSCIGIYETRSYNSGMDNMAKAAAEGVKKYEKMMSAPIIISYDNVWGA